MQGGLGLLWPFLFACGWGDRAHSLVLVQKSQMTRVGEGEKNHNRITGEKMKLIISKVLSSFHCSFRKVDKPEPLSRHKIRVFTYIPTLYPTSGAMDALTLLLKKSHLPGSGHLPQGLPLMSWLIGNRACGWKTVPLPVFRLVLDVVLSPGRMASAP